MENADRLPQDFGSIAIWAFDASGALSGEFRTTRRDIARGYMDVDLPTGIFTFVAWGTSGRDLESGGYRIAGVSQDDFLLHLTSPVNFDELFYAIARNVEVSDTRAAIPLEFMRHTNLVRVRLTKWGRGRADAPPDIYVTGRKGLYAYDGMIHPDTPEHRYNATEYKTDGGDICANLHLQRFDVEFHAENPVLLHVEREGVPLIVPLDLVSVLRSNPAYSTQAALDRASRFDIEIRHKANMEIQVSVDGWVVENIGAETRNS